jgi:hypothetical protein
MKAGACERSEVRAGIIKVREDFFDTKFHDGTQARESTHKTITISQHHECCVTHTATRVMKIKKKNLLMTMYDDKYDVMMSTLENLITT